ncbi:hypothetical protein BCR44DRAFT_43102, partial [Catenaria anguillulae PL171]
MRFSILSLALLAVVAVGAPAVPVRNNHTTATANLQERGIGDWLSGNVVEPLIDQQVAPAMRASFDTIFIGTKKAIVFALPRIVNDTVAQAFGLEPIVANVVKCPWPMQTLCNAVFSPIDKIGDAIKSRVKATIDFSLDLTKNTITDITIAEIKYRLLIEQDEAKRQKWGIHGWYKTKINEFVKTVQTALKTRVHGSIETATNGMLVVVPADASAVFDTFLPDGLFKGSVVAEVRDKANELFKGLFGSVREKIQGVMGGLEAKIMVAIEETTKKSIAAAIP